MGVTMTAITKHSSVKGSLQSIANKTGITVAQAFVDCEIVVLMDVSASMRADDYYDGNTRYKKACNQLAKLQSENPGKVCLISFNDRQAFCPSGIANWPSGSTDIAGALNFIKRIDNTGIKIVLISDGEPDDEQPALDQARQFKTKINCIYIGVEGESGADFLRRLSAVTGGQFSNSGVAGIGQLSQTVHGLLTQ